MKKSTLIWIAIIFAFFIGKALLPYDFFYSKEEKEAEKQIELNNQKKGKLIQIRQNIDFKLKYYESLKNVSKESIKYISSIRTGFNQINDHLKSQCGELSDWTQLYNCKFTNEELDSFMHEFELSQESLNQLNEK